ncbi:hypothetical protein KFK09_025541 [Dendrobium nobile]|uniref:Uncharacterized protein n=1 Tax=Dendrobium nobile TaxID=94219 RepID=A0A8T3A5W7_DENNO|nr:hypothetical protein KFK09_025541 [Dendrobium nobile]
MANRIIGRKLTMGLLMVLFSSLISPLISLDGGEGMIKAAAAAAGDNNKGKLDPASTNYVVLDRNPKTGQERFFCLARGRCRFKIIQCPAQCPRRKPKKNRIVKACFADCSSRCETTCKHRLPNCNGFGSICYDPRFIGGDGTMFYFHGAKGGNFALVSDRHLHINAHFIGIRPVGRSRDFTWVQALAIMFESHSLVIAARRVAVWDDSVDVLSLLFDGVAIALPIESDGEWRSQTGEVVVERTSEANSVRMTVHEMLEMEVRAVGIGEEENRTHGYGLPSRDAFAHLEMQFKFKRLSDEVEGVLGQTYRAGYISPVKKGVAMPMMGGEDRYQTPGFMSPHCGSCRFQLPNAISGEAATMDVALY